DRALEPLGGERLDLVREVLAHPVQLEAVGRGHPQHGLRLVEGDRHERAYPGADLLRGELLFEAPDAGLPELVHCLPRPPVRVLQPPWGTERRDRGGIISFAMQTPDSTLPGVRLSTGWARPAAAGSG